jgi:aminoglycoside phosphotransferase (APT) family kinase protein
VIRGTDISALDNHADAPKRLSGMMVDTLAALHRVDARQIGLEDLGKPDGFIGRAISGWSKRAALVARDDKLHALASDISEWLLRQTFRERQPTLLHCDFKLDNLILNPQTLDPVALVDWDMGTRGDPMFDLATLLSYWVEPDDPPALQRLGQMPTAHDGFWRRADVARRYAELTGNNIDDLPGMRVLALFKLGVVFLQLHQQWLNGAVKDDRYAGFGSLGEDILLVARDAIRGSE